jgi:hypothetical protein
MVSEGISGLDASWAWYPTPWIAVRTGITVTVIVYPRYGVILRGEICRAIPARLGVARVAHVIAWLVRSLVTLLALSLVVPPKAFKSHSTRAKS